MKYLDFSEIFAIFRSFFKNEVFNFENEFSSYIGCKHALGTSYGRTALYLALRAINAEGKEVMVPAFTCKAVRDAIILSGAKPIFIDVSPDDFTMDLSDAQKKITNQTVAIILTHYYGYVYPDIRGVRQFSNSHSLFIIEDCAHSLGAEHYNKKVGNFGDISIFSLTKNTLNLGGGVFCTNNEILFKKAKGILERSTFYKRKDFFNMLLYGYETTIDKVIFDRVGKNIFKWWLIFVPGKFASLILNIFKNKKNKNNHEKIFYSVKKYQNIINNDLSFTLRMYPVIASVGLIQLNKIERLNDNRIKIAEKLCKKLCNYCIKPVNSGSKNIYTDIVFNFENQNINDLRMKCKSKGLLLRETWPVFQTYFQDQDTKNIKKIKNSLLLFNINPNLKDYEAITFIKMIKEFVCKDEN